ncbi:MAG: transposase [Verrucomicrobiota bacterium]
MPNNHKDREVPARQPIYSSGNLSEVIFLTVCTKQRKPILASDEVHSLLCSLWSDPTSQWSVGRYMILPDHIHLFCSPKSIESTGIHSWTKFWKSQSTRSWPIPNQKPIWQRQFWDTQLRAQDSYSQKWNYVQNNPVRHALVSDPTEWPYQGEIEALAWHDR